MFFKNTKVYMRTEFSWIFTAGLSNCWALLSVSVFFYVRIGWFMYSAEKSPPLEETAVLFHSIQLHLLLLPPSLQLFITHMPCPPPQSHTHWGNGGFFQGFWFYTEPQRLGKLWLVQSFGRKKTAQYAQCQCGLTADVLKRDNNSIICF